MGESTEGLTTQIEGTRAALASDLDALQERVSPHAIMKRRKAAARDRMRSVKTRVMGTAPHDRSSASSVSGAADTVRGTAQEAVSTAEEKVVGSPLAAGLVAFGAGMVIAAVLPSTDAEARVSQGVADAAKEYAQPVVDEAKSMGQELGEQMKQSATAAAQDVKDTARQSAERVQEEGSSAVQSVRSETQPSGESRTGM